MKRRVEDKIRNLCSEIVTANDDEGQVQRLALLRDGLHQHVERLRDSVATYPITADRRNRSVADAKPHSQ